MKTIKYILSLLFLLSAFSFMACSDDDVPPLENEEELIDKVTLTFLPSGGASVTVSAIDPDGEGPQSFSIPEIVLAPNTSYVLSVELENTQNGEIISEEVAAEAEEHTFFFGWTQGLFSDPGTDGNIGEPLNNNAVNYADSDSNGLPIGLLTDWTTAGAGTGSFNVVLKHQPGIKTATATSSDGETDVDVTFDLVVQ